MEIEKGDIPPKDEPNVDLSKADALYNYHIRNDIYPGLHRYYVALSAEEIDTFIDLFLADRKTFIKYRAGAMLYLALYSYACGEKLPDRLYRELIDRYFYCNSHIYLRADEKFADELIDILDEADDYSDYVEEILSALTMIGGKRANDFIIENSKDPLPIWAEKHRIVPKEYTKYAGWEAVEDGMPNVLFKKELTAFIRCEKSEASPLSPINSLAEVCGFCGQPLTLIFDTDIKLATCMYCSAFQTVFTKTDENGVLWHPANAKGVFLQRFPKYLKNDRNITDRFIYGVKPSGEARKATWTADKHTEINRTGIGGMPTVVFDIKYPKCPECGKTMRFAAQLDMSDIEEEGIGLFYFFVCEGCKVAGANYDYPSW